MPQELLQEQAGAASVNWLAALTAEVAAAAAEASAPAWLTGDAVLRALSPACSSEPPCSEGARADR